MTNLFRISTAALMAISALGLTTLPANAATCRDAHGRFTQCHSAAGHSAKTRMATPAKHKRAKKVTMSASKNTMASTSAQTPAAAPKTPVPKEHKS